MQTCDPLQTSTPQPDYRSLFKSCGRDVVIDPGVYIEHPQVMEVGDRVRIMRGFYMMGQPKQCRIANDVVFFPNCFVQGSPQRFDVQEKVRFFPNTYISLGDWHKSFVHVGHHSHFAPNCVLYGQGGLHLGPYCNIAAHVVFATVGHHEEITDKPMALTGAKAGPITLEEDVWIGANSTITAHTRIARGCVVGANAVVTHDTTPMGVYVGVPARYLRRR